MADAEKIRLELASIRHPEINASFKELGMIADVRVKKSTAVVTLKLPFKEVPIRDLLVKKVKDAIKRIDENLKVMMNFEEMNEKERKNFFGIARERWTGLREE